MLSWRHVEAQQRRVEPVAYPDSLINTNTQHLTNASIPYEALITQAQLMAAVPLCAVDAPQKSGCGAGSATTLLRALRHSTLAFSKVVV